MAQQVRALAVESHPWMPQSRSLTTPSSVGPDHAHLPHTHACNKKKQMRKWKCRHWTQSKCRRGIKDSCASSPCPPRSFSVSPHTQILPFRHVSSEHRYSSAPEHTEQVSIRDDGAMESSKPIAYSPKLHSILRLDILQRIQSQSSKTG